MLLILQVFHIPSCDPLSVMCSQVPVSASNVKDRELPSASFLSAKVNLGLVLGESEECHANQVATPASTSEGSASLGEPEEDGNHSHQSHSPASSQCSATYSNLGKDDTCTVTGRQFSWIFANVFSSGSCVTVEMCGPLLQKGSVCYNLQWPKSLCGSECAKCKMLIMNWKEQEKTTKS